MKLEKIKSNLKLKTNLFFILEQNRFFNIHFFVFHKSIFLLCLILGLSSFNNKIENHFIQNEAKLKKITTIQNPSERALKWVLYVYRISNDYPQVTAQQLAIAETLWSASNYPYKKAIILWTQAEINRVKGKHNSATNDIMAAIKILEGKALKSKIEKQLLSLAYSTFARFSKYTKNKDGLPFAYKALETAISINYPAGEVLARNQLGMIIGYNQNNYTLALEHFMKAKELLPLLSRDVFDVINGFVLCNIAKAWSDLGDKEKSITYKLQLLEEEENIKNIELLTGIYNNLGTNYYDLKKYELAEKYLQKTLDLMEEHQLLTHKGVPLLRLGLIQLYRENILAAGTYADAIDFWLINHQFIGKYEFSFYQFKSKIAKANLDFKQAIFWLEKAAKEQEIANKVIEASNLVKLEAKNKSREIKQEQLLLEKELALNKALITTQNIVLFAVSFITILSIWFGVSFYGKTKELKQAYNFILNKKKDTLPPTKIPVKKIIKNKSTISKEIDKILKQKILYALEVEKIFLTSDLTLKKFADYLSSNTSYVSQTINEGYGKNFSSLINEYRIKEILYFFEEGQHKLFTIESLYKKAGFKSKSAFQKAFKSSNGVTASYYLEHISAQK